MNCWEEARLSGLVLGKSHIGQPPQWTPEGEDGVQILLRNYHMDTQWWW